ncbi:sigma-54-dependent Fis family transcriptional regulator [Thermodesulfomicrobium sp. WS]|uniref:sigma-54-dependent transcriptional regulator n=1 Tax=Thermodesulfomicrobium sp. WS TaxID=3004129 RepID=UPI00249052FC|nr:sigma-54 dependent transcriptional regulator [Thermodesulfomicrobium sp. WS]BDV01522.1 sigma-54-dependent Fis family transcriptional regulator [Thermodesulfomicrobium sp. WS]
MSATILIIDDETDVRLSLRGILEDEGHGVLEAASGEEGLATALAEDVDLIFLDIWMPGMDGMETLAALKAKGCDAPVVVISGHGNVESAVRAMKMGAFDFIEKPLSLDAVLMATAKALEVARLKRENRELRRFREEEPQLIGVSPAMVELRTLIAQVAPTDATVLLCGENGTGKEVAARSIHALSHRSQRPMVCVNCAAIPEELIESELFGHEKGAFTGADKARRGKFELADKGTLFLDEIGDMSLKTQAKVLRVLQERRLERVGGSKTVEVDVRVIAATNKDLQLEMAQGRFRSDLFYRLNVFPLSLAPLRQRTEDIPLLLTHFVEDLGRQRGGTIAFAPDAVEALMVYAWPGNVRELKNMVERLCILYPGQTITKAMLPPEYRQTCSAAAAEDLSSLPFKEARSRFEEQYLRAAYARFGANMTHMAEAIGLERTYLYRKLKTYGIA